METVQYKNYGKCAKFERNGRVLMVTLDVGPRIIYYGTRDFNFLNEDLERNVSKGGEYFDKNFKSGETWYLYGGHRVWKSPEDLETYVPDNYPVEFEPREFGGKFTGRTAHAFDYALDVEMDENGGVRVKNTITNKSDERREISVWALTVATKGGVLAVPLNEPSDELNPVQNFVHWPYNDLKDERLKITKTHLFLRQTDKPDAFKIGMYLNKSRAYYVCKNKAFRIDYPREKGVFGDFWCNFETYTNAHILEMEGLSERYSLDCGECAEFEEKWSISDNAPDCPESNPEYFV